MAYPEIVAPNVGMAPQNMREQAMENQLDDDGEYDEEESDEGI